MEPVPEVTNRRRMVDRLTALRADLGRERSLSPAARPTNASDTGLDVAIGEVSQAVNLLADGRDDAALTVLTRTSVRIVDSWSYVSPICEALIACKQDLQHVADARYAREWSNRAPSTTDDTAGSARIPEHDANTPPDDGSTIVDRPGSSYRKHRTHLPRALLIAAAAVAAVCGVAVLYSLDLLSTAGPFVAPILILAAITLTLAWFAYRTTRLRRNVVRRLRTLAPLVRAELTAPPPTRTSGISTESLWSALRTIEDALRAFAHHDGDPGTAAVDRLVHIASTWPPRSALAVNTDRLARTQRRLSKVNRNTDHLTTVLNRHREPENPRDVKTWDRWLIRFPVYSLLVALGCFSLSFNGPLPRPAAVLLTALGMLVIAMWQRRQQTRK